MTSLLNFIPPVIAHRGASAYAPENTMIAFMQAAQLGIKWLEFDVTQDAFGEPIVFHDDTLDRTTNGHGKPGDYPFAYLRTLDAGAWFDLRFSGEPIPSLQEVIHFLQTNHLAANVEIKSLPQDEEILVRRVVTLLSQQLPLARILFSSFSVNALHHLRHYAPTCLLGLLLHDWEPGWQETCVALNCQSVHVNHEIMTPQMAKLIKDMNKVLLCYTVNDRLRAKELYSWGVDAVFSDKPDQIIK